MPATSDKQKRSTSDKEMMMIMKHVNLTVQGDRSTKTRTKGTRRRSRKDHSSTMWNISQRKAAASPEASKNRCRCPTGAGRWYGHQEETITANIENKTAKVGSISSDMASERRQPVQMAQFLQKEIDTQSMNIVVAALTTGIDATVSQPHRTAQQQFQPQAQPQQFQTTFEAEQSLESKTDRHRGEQDGQRHCRR